MEKRKNRKALEGKVISNKMLNTIVVQVESEKRHPKYEKLMKSWKKYYVHTDKSIETGKTVKIMETRPLSRLKRWRVVEVI